MPHPARTTILLLNFLGLQARAETPLAGSERGIANPFAGKELVVAGDEEAGVDDGVRGFVVVIFGGIEIVEAAVFFGEATVVVEAEAGGEAEVREDLIFVLEKETGFL